MKIVYFRVGWMKNYNGLYKDSIQHGGSYNKDNIGHEIYNFQNIDNKYYGFVQVIHGGSINIARIGEPTTDKYIEDVLVVFVAKDGYNGQKIVGWYLNSTVFKDRMYLKDEQLVNREYKHINEYRAVSKQAVLLDVKDRTFIINGLGQSNIWYGDNDTNLKVYKYIYNYSKKRGINMKLYKLNQGSTFENLKHFIYLTNEYGVPSDEFVDDFIEQFGKVILNDNFTITQNQIKQLDELWEAIVKDCTNNNIEYKENYSNIFYTVLNKKALAKIKEGWEQSEWEQLTEQDKLELLKQLIVDFDKHKDEFKETFKYNYVLTNKRYIGHELTITESVDDIQSSYKVKVVDNVNVQLADTNLIININKFIEEIENRNVQLTITMGFFKFEDIYMEEK